jgi:imidazolonepropionase-like amidohydrolase
MRLLLALAWCAATAAAQRPTLALVGGTLIDGNGGPPLRNSVVLVADDRITAVGTVGTLAVPAGTRVISTEGMSVLPGLWDMHVHLMLAGHGNYGRWHSVYPALFEREIIPATAKQLLEAGVTSARDLGAPLDAILNAKRRIDRGDIPGPTIYASGPFLQHQPYPGTDLYRWGVNGVDDARAKVRRLAQAGVQVIKLIDQDQMTMDEVRAIVDEAHAHKLPVVAHAHRPEEIRRGVLAGVDCFEHTGLQTANAYPADVLALLAERSAQGNRPPLFWTPTIDVLATFTAKVAHDEFLDDPAWRAGLPDSVARDIRASLARLDTLSYYRFVPSRERWLKGKFEQLRASGVRLLIGTDGGVPANFHTIATANEMVTWVRTFGVDPMETIRAATFWPAVAMGVDADVGTVERGKRADIIAVPGDVLADIAILRRVPVVVKGGRVVKG